jgi:tRNA dimethylallyltransferase
MEIGTASPTQEQLERVKHYFVGKLELDEYYSAAKYEEEVLSLTADLYKIHDTLILSGGSMMYIDAVCNGIDDIPTVNEDVRSSLKQRYQEEGIDKMLAELKLIDPQHYDIVDHKNWKRIIHALEIFYTTGKPYSSFLTRKTLRNIDKKLNTTNRPFRILKIGLERPREELFERINSRVDTMINSGLLHEAMSLYKHRDKNALNTVGYKEMFNVLDGTWELPMAIERIKKNTRVYAKKQLTWFKHDNEIKWFHPDDIEEIHKYIEENL